MSRQNIYDDPEFFAGYAAMRARRAGLHERVIEAALPALAGELAGRRVVDLGCGDGWFARIALAAGAAEVTGIDPSERMLAAARTLTPGARFLHAFAEDAALPPASVDAVVSILALHYVEDLPGVLARVASWLAAGGTFVMIVEHPLATAVKAPPGGAALPEHTTLAAIAGRYAEEGPLSERWFTDGVIKYHRRLGSWLNAVIDAGLTVTRVAEPANPHPSAAATGIDGRHPLLAISARR